VKVLTLHQPWASLIAVGVKTIETRSWSTQYRGPLAIHAGAKFVFGEVGEFRAETWFSDLQHVEHCYCDDGEVDYSCQRGATRTPCLTKLGERPIMLPLGAIVATCALVDVVPIRERQWPEPEGLVRPYITVHPDGSRLLKWQRHLSKVGVNITDQLPYGDYSPGRYAWLLADVVPVDPPVPFKGGQGLTKTWEPLA
jgi:hypothetical protein